MNKNTARVIIICVWALAAIMYLGRSSRVKNQQPESAQEQTLPEDISKEVKFVGSGITPTLDKFLNTSPGTIMMYDFIDGGWENGGKFLLVISSNEEEVIGLNTQGKKISISTKNVAYIYDPKIVPQEYLYVSHTFNVHLAKSLAE